MGERSNRDVAREADVSEGTLRSYLRGETAPPIDRALRLAAVLGVSQSWLVLGLGAKYATDDPRTAELLRDLAGDQASAAARAAPARARAAIVNAVDRLAQEAGIVMVRHLGIEAGAGRGRYHVNDDVHGELAFREDWLRKKGINPRNAGIATVRGESMEPKLHDGDFVLVDRGDREVRSGRCYVLRQGDEIIVKYITRLPNGRLQATSENAAAFPPFLIELGVNVEIIGRVRADTHEWD
jgi:phage repressor protein C with HTH and peptisase S24 domain